MLRRYSRPRLLGTELSYSMDKWITLLIALYMGCNFFYFAELNWSLYYLGLIGVGMAALYFILPWKMLIRENQITELAENFITKFENDYT